jgi:hypothetical protein
MVMIGCDDRGNGDVISWLGVDIDSATEGFKLGCNLLVKKL